MESKKRERCQSETITGLIICYCKRTPILIIPVIAVLTIWQWPKIKAWCYESGLCKKEITYDIRSNHPDFNKKMVLKLNEIYKYDIDNPQYIIEIRHIRKDEPTRVAVGFHASKYYYPESSVKIIINDYEYSHWLKIPVTKVYVDSFNRGTVFSTIKRESDSLFRYCIMLNIDTLYHDISSKLQ